MGRVDLRTGGWFDPDKSRLILECTAYIDPAESLIWDYQTPTTTAYARKGIRLYVTASGAVIRRQPSSFQRNFSLPGPLVPVIVTSWNHDEIPADTACELLTHQLMWKEARAWFPTQFSPELACEWLIRSGKWKDAQKNFPQQYATVTNRMQSGQR